MAGTPHTTIHGAYFPELPNFYRGKVRDNYVLPGGRRLLIATDRQSAFDRVLAEIPHKGAVLNLLSAFWFDKTKDIVPNQMIEVIDSNAMLVKEAKALPVEVVVRGYITGVTTTSAWYAYEHGDREYCGHRLPEGLKKNQKLPKPIITPTTKAVVGHDEKISAAEIVSKKLVAENTWRKVEEYALKLFERGAQVCEKAGLILVDTKYEFGEDEDGNLILIDEVHTPDSSRFWKADSYSERFANGLEPESLDKEFLRIWLKEQGFTGDGPLPQIPAEFLQRFSKLYVNAFEQITRTKLECREEESLYRLRQALCRAGVMKGNLAVLIMGSESDLEFSSRIEKALNHPKVAVQNVVASAHKNPEKVLELVNRLNDSAEPVVYITVAGRSNALSGVVAAQSVHPVIACPPFKDKADYLVNIHSSLQMPSNVPVLTVLEPENAALAVKRIMALR